MNSKINIYNTTMTIICAAAVIFSASSRDNIALRLVCAVAAVALLAGIIVKLVKGGAENGRNEA